MANGLAKVFAGGVVRDETLSIAEAIRNSVVLDVVTGQLVRKGSRLWVLRG